MDDQLIAKQVGDALLSKGWMLACAESCTGGGIAAAVTDIPGSSQWFDRGFITYSNQSKLDMLGVKSHTLAHNGAVSEATVAEMVAGALLRSQAKVALAVSGIAGPAGGTVEKPVGTVCLAWQVRGQQPILVTEHFAGDRADVRRQTVHRALQGVLDVLGQE